MKDKIKVLVVDDEPQISKTLTLLLESRQYEVDIAESGEQALVKALKKPDIVLLDLVLPDISGFDVCRKLREQKNTKDIPIIILSVRHLYEDKVEGLYLGADDYLTKPFEYEELFARMDSVLRRRKSFSEEEAKEKAEIIQQLHDIIEQESITPFFQPIFLLRPLRFLGVELLSRPPINGFFPSPDLLFHSALKYGKYFDLEIMSWRKGLRQIAQAKYQEKIFLNCNPYLIESSNFHHIEPILKDCAIEPDKIVLEITERSAITNYEMFYQRLNGYQQKGFSVAIDDAGGGYASLESIVETNPKYVKIDLGLIRGIEHNPLKRSIVKFVVSFCKENKILSIAEGVEDQKELDTIKALDVDAVQGYFLGMPQPVIETKLPEGVS